MLFTIKENTSTQTILPRPSLQRPIKPQIQQPDNRVQTQQTQQQMITQQTPQMQQQNQQQPVANRLNAAAMNKRQIPNGSKNTVNQLKQAQKPLNIRK